MTAGESGLRRLERQGIEGHRQQPPLTLTIERDGDDPALLGPDSLLAHIGYGPSHYQSPADPRQIRVGLRALSAPPLREVWRVPGPVVHGWYDGIGYAQGHAILFAHLLVADTESADLTEVTRGAYTRLLGLTRSRGFPYPLRMWNFLSCIHGRSADSDRYQAFCVGRDRAFQVAGIVPECFPAATAVGAAAPGLLIYLFAGRTPGRPVENPRQVSAYRYPRRYGPRPPSFARALWYGWPGGSHFFVSGTASVVGHHSLHPGELVPQLHETLVNLDALLAGGAADRPAFLKVFLRDPSHLGQVEAGLRGWVPTDTSVLHLQAEVCRAELEIEIEGVCGPRDETCIRSNVP